MKEYIKLFNNLEEADGYKIKDIPWISLETTTGQLPYCIDPDKQTKVVDNIIYIDDTPRIPTILRIKNGADVEITDTIITSGITRPYMQSLTAATIGDRVTIIGEKAFFECSSLREIVIPNSIETPSRLTSIDDEAFNYCEALNNIKMPNTVTSIGNKAFSSCHSLRKIEIPSGVTSIGSNVFNYCEELSSITVDTGNTVYDSRNYCNAIIETSSNTLINGCKTTIIPSSVTSIGSYAFSSSSLLTGITIPNHVTSIGDYAFNSCGKLNSITIPSSVTSIGEFAFNNCTSLSGATIGSGVTIIGYAAFHSCKKLSRVTIGKGVTHIGAYAFYRCTSLNTINYNGTKSQWESISKGENWKVSVPATVVHCSNGDMPL